jgi:hypothetical protein
VAIAIASGAANAAPAGAAPACGASVATAVPQPSPAQMRAAGLGGLPAAPADKRVDLVAPPFSNPTSITNPLFPISELHSAVLNGKVEGEAFRTETTLLPDTRVIEWSPGQCVRTLVSQYVAYLDGRIEEVALDFYAQADDGSVWYFGEDVHNYVGGVIADTSGTWLAGKEGPAAMIMPADPQVGQVSRAENIPGLVWEEVAVKATGRTVRGPRGPVEGAIVARELHDDGTFSDKVFAPGYGEFFTASRGEVEALAVAVPIDSAAGPPPAALAALSHGTARAFRAATSRRWSAAAAAARRAAAAWRAHRRAGGVPPRLVAPTAHALAALRRAVAARRRGSARAAALGAEQAALDLELRYRSPAATDRARFELWTRLIGVDAAAGRRGAVSGDVATLEWIRDRIASTLDPVSRTRIDARLSRLRERVADGELRAAARGGRALRGILARAGVRSG